jgi:hypothetical protein
MSYKAPHMIFFLSTRQFFGEVLRQDSIGEAGQPKEN